MKLTSVNLWALKQHFAGRTETPNQMESTAVPHLRRCMQLGLVEVVGGRKGRLVLTPKGQAALAERVCASCAANGWTAAECAAQQETDADYIGQAAAKARHA